METGYTCTAPFDDISVCTETCGDGLMLGWYECDDGNLEDRDGCSSECKVEECWTCDSLSPTACTIEAQNAIGMQGAHLAEDNSRVSIYFNNSVVLTGEFDIFKALSVTVTGPYEPYYMDWFLEFSDSYFKGVPADEFAIVMDFKD